MPGSPFPAAAGLGRVAAAFALETRCNRARSLPDRMSAPTPTICRAAWRASLRASGLRQERTAGR